ncbi:MAG: sulfur carrier protein ThiS [Verrucomicrobia bacterium]|nr:sulfur carrier protein ThiS [Verrucomicrobiota bacterium]MCF7707967.1 sulfur carrier protein ThiS [Verrucomicrobiota bacterium]
MPTNWIIVNGKKTETRLPSTIHEFLEASGINPSHVVVEHNREAVAPSEFKEKPLQPEDHLEIITVVAGG